MKHMSFSATVPQMRARTKSVTRRLGWETLESGEVVMAVVKGQGLKKGEKVEKIHAIEITRVTFERLNTITRGEVAREGFPEMGVSGFIKKFCEMNSCADNALVTRIAFKHL